MQKDERLHNIEFLRFLFSGIIVYFHILHSNIMQYVNTNTTYSILREKSDAAGVIVECFFIISGYFLFISYRRDTHIDIFQFAVKKFFRLWPVLFFSILLGLVFFSEKKFPSILNSLFSQCIGLSLDYKGINWYISPLFWVSLFYFALLINFDSKKVNVIIAVLVYFSYVIIINEANGEFGRHTVHGIINLGTARAVAGIGLGYLIGITIECINSSKLRFLFFSPKFSLKAVRLIVGTIVELISLAFLLEYCLIGSRYNNQFIVVIFFSALLICFIYRLGALSKVLDNKIMDYFGKYTYSIYVMQQISFWILQRSFWKYESFINQVGICISISIIFCIVIGIITYYAIERPAIIVYSRYLK